MWPRQPFLISRNTAFIPQASRFGSLKYGFHPSCQAIWISKKRLPFSMPLVWVSEKRLPSSMPGVLDLHKTASILHVRGVWISKKRLLSSMPKVFGSPTNCSHPPCQGFGSPNNGFSRCEISHRQWAILFFRCDFFTLPV